MLVRGFIDWPLEILNIEPLQNSVFFFETIYPESLVMQVADFLVCLWMFKQGKSVMLINFI